MHLHGPEGARHREVASKMRSFVQDVLISRSPGIGESDLQQVNEQFEPLFNAASTTSVDF